MPFALRSRASTPGESSLIVTILGATQIRDALDDFVELLADAVDDGASLGFLSPLTTECARAFWDAIADDVDAGTRVVIAAIENNRIIGTAQLDCETLPNGRHRAEVQKVIVHRSSRQRGIGSTLMREIESAAEARDRTLLVLDTGRGGVAEGMYERIGYKRAGSIPGYAADPSGRLVDSVIYYKTLR